MKSKILIFLFLFFQFHANLSPAQNASGYTIGRVTRIYSKVLNSERELMIYVPASYHSGNYTKYPVLYLLDGEKFFHPFTGAVAQLSSDASPQIPEMIVVGITSKNRVKDSSPTHSLIGYRGKEEPELMVSGGADDFLGFIRTELIPFIDSNYRTNSYKIFTGYSFTGLPVLHSLFKNPDVFNSYIVIDFSAWWDDEVTLKNMKLFFRQYKGPARDVYLSTEERVLNDVYPEKENKTWVFIQEFEQTRPKSIGFGYKKYAYLEENHHSMPLVSFIDGLKYIFRGHMTNYYEMYTNPELIKARFSKLSERLGYNIYLREDLINFLGYQFLYTHPNLNRALFYFKINTENYPRSANAWDSLAEAYTVKGDTLKAVECYRKALQLDPDNLDIQNKIKKFSDKQNQDDTKR